MKKLFFALPFLIIIVIFFWHFLKPIKVQKFLIKDYNQQIANFPREEVLGKIENVNDVVKKAKHMFSQVYGKKDANAVYPYLVFYDSDSKTYLVQGTIQCGHDGGVPYMIIEKETGKVIAIWHDL